MIYVQGLGEHVPLPERRKGQHQGLPHVRSADEHARPTQNRRSYHKVRKTAKKVFLSGQSIKAFSPPSYI